jgi:IclR family pca regulon transcriptional regulator
MRTKSLDLEAIGPDSTYFIDSVQKAMEVLTCFNRKFSRSTLSEVSRSISVSRASARRSLLTLHALGFLESDGKYFWPSSKVLLIGHAYLTSTRLPSMAQPFLDALSERTKESSSIGQWLEDDAILVCRSTARRCLSTGMGVGSRLPAFCSSLGRVLLAGLPRAEAAQRIRSMEKSAFTERTIVDNDEVLEIVDACRARGYSSSDGEIELGVRSIAVPLREREGQTVAAISISVRAERMTFMEFEEACLPFLRKTRDQLESRLNA